MSAVAALPRAKLRDSDHGPASLEDLLVICLESLADLARERGQMIRAARLLEAAGLLSSAPGEEDSSALSQREWQVAALVARGLSNRQIAEELVVSDRTIDSHVSNILRKLALASRAQIAAWVVRRDLEPRARVQNVSRLRTVTGTEATANLAD